MSIRSTLAVSRDQEAGLVAMSRCSEHCPSFAAAPLACCLPHSASSVVIGRLRDAKTKVTASHPLRRRMAGGCTRLCTWWWAASLGPSAGGSVPHRLFHVARQKSPPRGSQRQRQAVARSARLWDITTHIEVEPVPESHAARLSPRQTTRRPSKASPWSTALIGRQKAYLQRRTQPPWRGSLHSNSANRPSRSRRRGRAPRFGQFQRCDLPRDRQAPPSPAHVPGPARPVVGPLSERPPLVDSPPRSARPSFVHAMSIAGG
jgi:hypothetical protein